MMNKYLLSKIAFIFFSVTTVIIFAILRFGDFIGLAGSVGNAFLIFGINTTLFLISVIFYIWQKAHKDTPMHQKSELLEAYAEDRLHEDEQSVHKFTVDEDLSAFSHTDKVIAIKLTEELSGIHNGEIIQLFSPLSTGSLTVKVLSKQNGMMQLRIIR